MKPKRASRGRDLHRWAQAYGPYNDYRLGSVEDWLKQTSELPDDEFIDITRYVLNTPIDPNPES